MFYAASEVVGFMVPTKMPTNSMDGFSSDLRDWISTTATGKCGAVSTGFLTIEGIEMKLNIEELAKQAGWGNVVSMPHINALEAFASLIVERCAVEADARLCAGDAGPMVIARAIRNLLEEK